MSCNEFAFRESVPCFPIAYFESIWHVNLPAQTFPGADVPRGKGSRVKRGRTWWKYELK